MICKEAGDNMENLSEGSSLQERYKIKKVIGKGAMGTIYIAWDSRLSHDRAVKEMNPSFLEEEEKEQFMDLFKQEAHILSRLHHSNLPKVIDYFFEDGRYYLVMDYIDGKNLKEYKEKAASLIEVEKIKKIVFQLCDVLDYLHNQKPDPIIFRDLKPSNIMITEDLTVKLIDFGIARIFKDSKKCDTVIVGTPGFAPPEQYGKRQTDEKSDIYSLGATLYYMLSGEVPDLPDEKGKKEIQGNPKITHNLKPVILKCLSPEPADRYKNIKKFKEAFKEAFEKKLPEKKEEPKKPVQDKEEKSINTFTASTLAFLFMLLPSGIIALSGYLWRIYHIPHLDEQTLLKILCGGGTFLLTAGWFAVINKLRKIDINWIILSVLSIVPILLNARNIFVLLIPEWGQRDITIVLFVVLLVIMYIASMAAVTFFRHKKVEYEEIKVEEKKDIYSFVGLNGTANSNLRPQGTIIVDGEEEVYSAFSKGGRYIKEGERVKIVEVKMGDLVVEALENID